MLVQCNSCDARFDVTGKKPGAVFKCPKCENGRIQVPEETEELSLDDEIQELPDDSDQIEEMEEVEEPAPPPRTARTAGRAGAARGGRRSSGRSRAAAGSRRRPTRERAEKKGGGLSPAVLGAFGVAVVVVVVVLIFVLKGGDSDDGNGGGNGNQVQNEPVKQENPTKVFGERLAALSPTDAAGRASLAAYCAEHGINAGDARKLNREALLLDPYNASARTALGFKKYDGSASRYQGRWLSESDYDLAVAAERFEVGGNLSAAATSADVFLREAEKIKARLSREFTEDKWLYAYGEDLMPQPFFVVIEKKGNEQRALEYAKEYAATLSTLYEAFYERFEEMFQLEEIERPIRVVMFDSKRSYSTHRANHPEKNYTDPTFIGGYYQPWEQQLIMWRQNSLRGVLFHEGTHMFVHYAFSGRGFEPSNQSPWFQEGFAEYFGGYKVEEKVIDGKKVKTFVLGQFLPNRYGSYRMLRQVGACMTIQELVKFTSGDFGEAKRNQSLEANMDKPPAERQRLRMEADLQIQNVYGTGWAFVMYLNNARDGIYRKVFDEYFKHEVNGAGHWGSLAELMGLESQQDWDDLDEDFTDWAENDLK